VQYTQLYVEKLLFDESFEAKNRKLAVHVWSGMYKSRQNMARFPRDVGAMALPDFQYPVLFPFCLTQNENLGVLTHVGQGHV